MYLPPCLTILPDYLATTLSLFGFDTIMTGSLQVTSNQGITQSSSPILSLIVDKLLLGWRLSRDSNEQMFARWLYPSDP